MSPALLMVIKVTVVFAVAWLAQMAMQRASASLRYLVVALALVAGLLLPALELIVPRWEVIPMPASEARAITGIPLSAPSLDVVGPVDPTRFTDSKEVAAPVELEVSPKRTVLSWRSPVTGLGALETTWLVGTIALLAFLGLRILAMMVAVRRAEPLEEDAWNTLLVESLDALGIRRPVRLLRRREGEMPAVWGLRNSVILLPAECTAWPAGRCHAVLTHELAHVARRDVLMLTLGHVVCALHWFNPLAWALQHRLAVEREHACDDVALTRGLKATHYARHLVSTAVAYRKQRSLAPVMAARSQLEGRIMAILDTDRNRRTATRTARLAIAALVLVALVPLSSLSLAEPREDADGFGRVSQSDTADFMQHLAEIGYGLDDTDRLIAGIDSASALTRGACAWALGKSGDSRAIDPLISALDDGNDTVREWAVRSLGSFSDERIIEPLIGQLSDPEAEVRQWSVRALADVGDERVIEPLIDRLADPDAEVREWSARALADVDDARVRQALRDQLDSDPDPEVREWAARALAPGRNRGYGSWDRNGVEPLMPVPRRPSGPSEDPETMESLIDALGDENAQVREWAVRSLGAYGDPRAIAPLTQLLDDPNPDVRRWAERALENIEG